MFHPLFAIWFIETITANFLCLGTNSLYKYMYFIFSHIIYSLSIQTFLNLIVASSLFGANRKSFGKVEILAKIEKTNSFHLHHLQLYPKLWLFFYFVKFDFGSVVSPTLCMNIKRKRNKNLIEFTKCYRNHCIVGTVDQ